MTTYARIDASAVAEVIVTDGDITRMFHPSLVWADVTSADPVPQVGWSAIEAGGAWTFAPPAGPPVVEIRSARIAALSVACQTAIEGGFGSSALGAAHTYPSTATDQANLVQAASSPSGGALWCRDESGTWAMLPHTQDQAKTALTEFVAARNGAQAKLATLASHVEAAETADAVAAIGWDD